MSDYTKTTDFAAKDSLPSGDTGKIIKGAEFETEFDAISTAIATKANLAGPTFTGTITLPTVDINAGAIDGTTIGASSAAAGTFTNLVATSADINGGTVDGATIGGSSAGAGTFTNLTASGTVNFNGATISNLGTITTANLDGGTADNVVIGGSTPAAGTFTSVVATTADINGGTIDGVSIGSSSAGAGAFSSLTVGGTAVLTSVAFSNIDAGAITTSGETFADSDTQIPTNAAVKDHVEAVIPTLSVTESSVTAHQAALAIAATQLTGNITVPGNVRLAPSGTNFTELYGNTNAGAIRFNCESNSHGVTLKGPPHSAGATYSLELPNADGSAGQFLKTDGSGKLAFDSVSAGTFTATASGALSNGDTVIINSDGTVTAVGTSVSALNPPTKGTAAEFESGTTGSIAAVFDPDNNKVVVAYSDQGDSNKGKAAVGTVSGTSISFGTPVEFEAGGTSYIAVTYDTNADKVVIAYADAGNSSGAGTAIVGTVSGTSISFGTAVVYNNAETTYQGITFDSSNNKVVVCYRDNGNSNYGTAIVGTVSGTSISFGSEVVFNSANSMYSSATFDSSNNKVVIVYRDGGNSNRGTAIVGTVSGTSISFGSEVVFDGNNGSEWTAATFDSNSNKVVVFYQDDTDTETNAIIGTVSGTSISFGTAVQVLDGNNVYHNATFNSTANTVLVVLQEETTEDIELFIGTVSGTSITFGTALKVAEHAAQVAVVYDTNAQKGVVLYDDDDDSSKGKGVVTTVNTTATNLTPENYVGISNGAYSNSATATIQISGELDDAQSSLTPGQVYYVQGDGSLGLKPDVPAVVAGIAISATKLMLELSKEPAVTEQNSTAITSSSNAATINLRDGDNFTHTLTENVTYTFSNPAASGRVSAFTLKVIQDSSARTITWPSSVDWAAATAPTLSTGSGNVDVFVFITYDGGTNYYGFTAGQAMA